LTKKFEHTERGTLSELVTWAAGSPKGEMVMIIGGASPKTFDVAELGLKALELAASGLGLKQACADLSEATGASKSAIYAEALLHKP
jgi:16S rRNA (cytidine1402-2'-O)-methyltransferase